MNERFEELQTEQVKDFPLYANQALIAAFKRLQQTDRLLQQTIKSLSISSSDARTLILQVDPGKLTEAYKKLFKIVQLAWLISGDRFCIIQINGHPISIAALLKLQPNILRISTGVYDKKSSMEQISQEAQRYRALLGYTTSNATVFIISTSGVYKDVHIQKGIDSKISVEAMLNKPLDHVLPDLEIAFYILKNIQEAYALNEKRTIEYGLWDRSYRAEIIPIQGGQEVVLVCNRLH